MTFKLILALLFIVATTFMIFTPAEAAPYGAGVYDANVLYGGETQLSISTSGDVSMNLTPTGGPTSTSASGTVTVTTSDVNGYRLYIRGLTSSDMVNGSNTLPASAHVIPGSLVVNTWGYNLDASSDYAGLTTDDVLIRSTTAPDTTGDVTTVTYGANVDNATAAGFYTSNIVYTAVPHTN